MFSTTTREEPEWFSRGYRVPGENMASAKNYDVVIIGSGTAGASAAIAAVHLGKSRVVMVERGTLWGTCVNYGCIPSKFLLTAAERMHEKDQYDDGKITSDHVLAGILEQKNALIEKLRRKKYKNIIETLGVEIVQGEAAFLSPTELRVGDDVLTAPRFIIATGSSGASFPPLEGIATVKTMTNIEALEPQTVPESLIIIGGRALGLEFSQIYAHLGTKVTLLQRKLRIRSGRRTGKISEMMANYLAAEGIDIRKGVNLAKVAEEGRRITVSAKVGGKTVDFSAERILFATGRSPNTRELHLERAGSTDRQGRGSSRR